MNFDLTPTQILCLLSYGETPDRINQLVKDYGTETIYNDCMWLKEQGYLANNIQLALSLSGQFYSTNVGQLPAFTDKGLEAYNYYSSL